MPKSDKWKITTSKINFNIRLFLNIEEILDWIFLNLGTKVELALFDIYIFLFFFSVGEKLAAWKTKKQNCFDLGQFILQQLREERCAGR